MKADQLDNARNPLLPAAMVAIQRAAYRARQEALRTHTGIIITRAGRIERIDWNRVSESAVEYHVPIQTPRNEDDS
ncbi:MAG: hypothetical protein G8D81_04885 [gamma proteobacterium symbiont of Clathrolucina costata]|uniref:Uncharacterized protein n=1 Tax=Candidatus Thiodiazotropha taylori TaxID=2792791 RepID=A0A9E4TUZ0_9GAMM|nr:hypothetical protein [Candidatus Thiodiazotropha sp. (ex Codakia orbicularis)]MBV2127212.1 hypothetical protein [Candidatus Thiodiazotropha taylori]MCG7980321.1 hypothetical protein [Candidatus Thiodiazotropha taylori]MCW4238456.1 hypothetical protein [Candidatus Thiodiazotropha endolucinida]